MNTQKQYTKENDLLSSLNINYNKHNIYKLMKMLNRDLSYRRKNAIEHTYKTIKALRAFSLDSEHGGRGIDGTPFSQHIYSKKELIHDLPKMIDNDKKEITKNNIFGNMQKDLKNELIKVESKYKDKIDESTIELFDSKVLNAVYNNGYNNDLIKWYKNNLECDKRTLYVIKKLDINYYSYESESQHNNERISYKRLMSFYGMSLKQAKKAAYNYNFMAKYNINFYPATFKSARAPFDDWYTFYKINNF